MTRRCSAFLFLTIVVVQLFAPLAALAVTNGPTQPEVQGFQPASATEMVDIFTGDFSYNIPLLELPGPNGGYPFSLSYQSGITMDQEASWVGLGWNLQPGSLTRQVRGLPDEFNGDAIKTTMSIDPNITVGLSGGGSVEFFGGDASLGIGFGVRQNTYKGFGYFIDASLGFNQAVSPGMTGKLGIGLTLDSQEGAGVSPSIGLGTKIGDIGLSVGYNSRQGLSALSIQQSFATNFKVGKENRRNVSLSGSSSAELGFAHPSYTPQVSMAMKNTNLSVTLKGGPGFEGVFSSIYVSGFYNVQALDRAMGTVVSPAYGYMNYQNASGDMALMDLNREKEGMVSEQNPNLPIPSQTYDVYSVTGQGVGMMYRPMRNDAGIARDQHISSGSIAAGLGVDIGAAFAHVGVNLSLNESTAQSGAWQDDNNLLKAATFQTKTVDNDFEPWYFKVHGENSYTESSQLSKIGGEGAVRVQLQGNVMNEPVANSVLETSKKVQIAAPDNTTLPFVGGRDMRSQMVSTITNAELLSTDSVELLPLYKVKYTDPTHSFSNLASYQRKAYLRDHPAAYTVTNVEGLRYIYALPAYNLKQEEVVFSAAKGGTEVAGVTVDSTANSPFPTYSRPNTNKFLKSTQTPAYAYAHLLTAVLGPDYVDVTNDGVTPDDRGYWVKFTYKRSTTKYQWRDPFVGAHFIEGWKTDPRDDQGSFTYGVKELWYLARAETKSHIVDFTIDETRLDGRGAAKKLQDAAATGRPQASLTSIKLYSRLGGPSNLIKTVKFLYDNSLCGNVYNASSAAGKLTLKKVWFEYGGSSRGSLSPYEFTYHGSNPNYDPMAYDRWGNYKPVNTYSESRDNPYTEQDPAKKSKYDSLAASWSLKKIKSPSGSTITVDYEIDDYAYVQNRPAAQMTSMLDPYTLSKSAFGSTYLTRPDSCKIRFALEQKIPGNLSPAQQKAEVLKYLDTKNWQVYFKALVDLRSSSENFDEYICGYADINQNGLMKLERDASNQYAFGCFQLKQEKSYDPITLRAWQHIRTNQPELANSGRVLANSTTDSDKINQIKGLVGILPQIRQLFQGFTGYCNSMNWGKRITSGKSWVRLYSRDQIKYGGGIRVKQITMTDGWREDSQGTYGEVYDYTQIENGQTISSGVAAYEPIVGGDENSLHYAKKYTESIPLRSDNNLFFEFPANEQYYPSPQVGYAKVTTMSLPSAVQAKKTLARGGSVFPTGTGIRIGTSGMTVHEFYTARDFPVIADETDKDNRPFKMMIPIPLIGAITASKLTASQGYVVMTNDMHGKQKAVSTFRQNIAGTFEATPATYVKYKYKMQSRVVNGDKVNELNNDFYDNGDGTLSPPTTASGSNCSIAQETDFFYDMREFEDVAHGGGARINIDMVVIPLFIPITIPIPTVWPGISKSTNQLRTAVANKIIFKSGILLSTESNDGTASLITTNYKWDKLTGTPVVVGVNNNFDDQVYSYTKPAYQQYQGMGAAYANTGLTFSISNSQKHPTKANYYIFYPGVATDEMLQPGDEFLIYTVSNGFKNPVARGTYAGKDNEDNLFYCETNLPNPTYLALIVRSGARNQLTVSLESITSLQDPSVPGTAILFTKTINVPK